MSKYLLTVIFLILLSGCGNKSDDQSIQKIKQNDKKTDSVKAQPKPEFYEGIYLTNLNTHSFVDCQHPDSVYWVIDDTKKLEGQYKKLFSIPSVYNSVFVRVKGDFEITKDETVREKYPTTLRVKEVVAVEKKNFNNTCVPYDFWALGNEPNWSLQISKNENLIELILFGENKSYYFFYEEPTEENGFIMYKNYNKIQGYSIEIKIKKEKCSDTMSDKTYDYSAEIELTGGKKFKGCAIKGREK